MRPETELYKVELDVFEGPLDLLLYLLRRDELDIYNIPIEKITEQYLEYLDTMRRLDLNIAGEFIVMAATLMMIKSRMLLPVEERDGEEEEEEAPDPRWDLVRQLVEYKKFKDAAAQLMDREDCWLDVFTPGANKLDGPAPAPSLALGDVGLFDLLAAFREVLRRAPSDEAFGSLEPLRWSVPDKIHAILHRLDRVATVPFRSLFGPRAPRGEVIVTFLALLELLRQRRIRIFQPRPFDAITLERGDADGVSRDAEPTGTRA